MVKQLKVRLLPQEKKDIGETPTDSVEAYTYYLRGRQFLHRHSKSNYQLARRMFAKAVELDPLYARAYAGIADCDSFLSLIYHLDVGIDSILATSAKALALENGLAEAHASRALALSLGKRYDEAIAEFEKAIARRIVPRNGYRERWPSTLTMFSLSTMPFASTLSLAT